MDTADVGIIGGTGLGDVLADEAYGRPVDFNTPYGRPSSVPMVADWDGVRVAFIARHGLGHRLNPSNVPYRANIWAMKKLGVASIIASGATGSLREEIEPGHLVLCDQVIDKTFRRAGTFFDEGLVVHVAFADPFCARLREILVEAGGSVNTTLHDVGTYVCMEGPQFSTRAESRLHRQRGGHLIGMTCMPEAKLAREAELCYALVALPTDYDCWRPADPHRAHDELLREIMGNLKRASDHAITLIKAALPLVRSSKRDCGCHEALKLAIWSDKKGLDPAVRQRLRPFIDRYLSDEYN